MNFFRNSLNKLKELGHKSKHQKAHAWLVFLSIIQHALMHHPINFIAWRHQTPLPPNVNRCLAFSVIFVSAYVLFSFFGRQLMSSISNMQNGENWKSKRGKNMLSFSPYL